MTSLLLEFALRSGLIAAGIATVLWLLRIKAPAARHAAWTAVVLAMLALPAAMAARWQVSLPVLRPAERPITTTSEPASVAPATSPSTVVDDSPQSSRDDYAGSLPTEVRGSKGTWSPALLGLYASVAFVLLLRLIVGTTYANRLRHTALVRHGRLTSDRCTTPITVGWFRPTLILPAGWQQWPAAQLNVVLTHEQAHARRHDPLVQWVALFNRAVFWFHPLAWWLERRLSRLAEEACDAAVIAAGHSPQQYSEYLLDMARVVSRVHGRVRIVGMAMPGAALPERVRIIFRDLPRARVSRLRVICAALFCATTSMLFAAGTPIAPRPEPSNLRPQQTATPMQIKFEAVSIRPCLDQGNAGGGRGANSPRQAISPGYASWGCVTLAQLIDTAWGGGAFPGNVLLNTVRVPPGSRPDLPRRIRGGPSWVEEERFAIEIRMSGDTTDAKGSARSDLVLNAVGPALRAMLEDRFQLKLRKMTEERPMYALTVAKSGLKIAQTAPSRCWVRDRNTAPDQAPPPPGFEGVLSCDYGANLRTARGNNIRTFTNINFTDFAMVLSREMDRYVLDKTGVEGRFGFTLEYAPDDSTPGDIQWAAASRTTFRSLRPDQVIPDRVKGDGGTIFMAIEALGLKLEPTRGPAEYLLIDSVQRPVPGSPLATGAGPGR